MFTLITVIFVVCVSYTVTSFKEMPLLLLEMGRMSNDGVTNQSFSEEETIGSPSEKNYGSLQNTVIGFLFNFSDFLTDVLFVG